MIKSTILSCFSRDFYQKTINVGFFRRFFHLYFLLILIFLSVTGYSYYYLKNNQQVINEYITKGITEIDKIIPQDLELKIENKILSMNKPSPYEITPSWWSEAKETKSFILFDMESSIEDFYGKDTLILFTKNGVGFDKSGAVQFYSFESIFKESPNFVFNYQVYEILKNAAIPYIETFKEKFPLLGLGFGLAMSLIAPITLMVFLIISLLFYSFLGLILSKITKRNLSYGDVYLSSMNLFIPITIVRIILSFFFSSWFLSYVIYSVFFLLLAPRKDKILVQ